MSAKVFDLLFETIEHRYFGMAFCRVFDFIERLLKEMEAGCVSWFFILFSPFLDWFGSISLYRVCCCANSFAFLDSL